MGNIISEIKKKIFKEYTDDLKDDKVRYAYDMNKIDWGKGNIPIF